MWSSGPAGFFFLLYWRFANHRLYIASYHIGLSAPYISVLRHKMILVLWKLTSGGEGREVWGRNNCASWKRPQKAYYITYTSQVNHWIHPEGGQCHRLLSQAPKETAKHHCLSRVPSKANSYLLEHYGIPAEKGAMTRSTTCCPLYQCEESLLSHRLLLIDHRGFLEICYPKDRSNLLWFPLKI